MIVNPHSFIYLHRVQRQNKQRYFKWVQVYFLLITIQKPQKTDNQHLPKSLRYPYFHLPCIWYLTRLPNLRGWPRVWDWRVCRSRRERSGWRTSSPTWRDVRRIEFQTFLKFKTCLQKIRIAFENYEMFWCYEILKWNLQLEKARKDIILIIT